MEDKKTKAPAKAAKDSGKKALTMAEKRKLVEKRAAEKKKAAARKAAEDKKKKEAELRKTAAKNGAARKKAAEEEKAAKKKTAAVKPADKASDAKKADTVSAKKPEPAAKSAPAKEAARGSESADYHVLEIESGNYETTYNKMFTQRKPWEPENPRHILAFMPGTVEEIKVKKGQKVSEGDSLLIFRAMKMNNDILAPLDGKIKAINAEEGKNIPKNFIMIELE